MGVGNSDKIIIFNYKFTFGDGAEKEFNIKLDNKTLDLIQTIKGPYPKWTELKYFKCLNCPLEEEKREFCPVAVSLVELINFFMSSISYEEVDVSIEVEERRYTKHTSLQKGLSSLIGIYMVTSGCPILEKFKPMVRHHLPFATGKETAYRVMSMYLFAQYFLYKRGKKPDWEFKDLVKTYNDVRIVNGCFSKRLTNTIKEDASVNALVILDSFADFVTFSIDEGALGEIELLFNAYFKQAPSEIIS